MTIIHAQGTIVAGASVFNPTIVGYESDYLVYSDSLDFEISPTNASASSIAGIWLLADASNCYIRCGADASGNTTADDNWYGTVGAAQGDPGSVAGAGTTVLTLNERPDTVNIYNVADNIISSGPGDPTFGNVSGGSSYTSDDKSTFFDPTNGNKYGRQVTSLAAETGLGTETTDGNFDIQFTFRKAGKPDYTVTFSGRGRAVATVDI